MPFALSKSRSLLTPVLVALTVLLCACSTPYQEDSFAREMLLVNSGGHKTIRISDNQYRIEYSSTPTTTDETLIRFITYRCSELAIEKGFKGFAFEVPISESPPRPQTKRLFFAQIRLLNPPYAVQANIVDAARTKADLEQFIRP